MSESSSNERRNSSLDLKTLYFGPISANEIAYPIQQFLIGYLCAVLFHSNCRMNFLQPEILMFKVEKINISVYLEFSTFLILTAVIYICGIICIYIWVFLLVVVNI